MRAICTTANRQRWIWIIIAPDSTISYDFGATLPILDYNTIYGWYENYLFTEHGSHTIYADPLLISATNHNLRTGSPCVDTGTDTGAPADDILGNERPFDGDSSGTAIVDIGAYEKVDDEIYLPLLLK